MRFGNSNYLSSVDRYEDGIRNNIRNRVGDRSCKYGNLLTINETPVLLRSGRANDMCGLISVYGVSNGFDVTDVEGKRFLSCRSLGPLIPCVITAADDHLKLVFESDCQCSTLKARSSGHQDRFFYVCHSGMRSLCVSFRDRPANDTWQNLEVFVVHFVLR